MDWIRFPYQTTMRMVEGRPGIPVRWFKARSDAILKPDNYGYGSRIWEDHWRITQDTGQFGEVYGQKPQWVSSLSPIPAGCNKGPYWPEEFRPGVPGRDADTFPALAMDGQGWPIACCADPQFKVLWPACLSSPIKRLEDRFWLRFSPGPDTSCWLTTTVVEMNRQSGGDWIGSADPGPHLLPIDVVLNADPELGGCIIEIEWHIEGLPSGQVTLFDMGFNLSFSIKPTTQIANPPYVQWLRQSGAGFNDSLLCDTGGGLPAKWFNVELLSSNPN